MGASQSRDPSSGSSRDGVITDPSKPTLQLYRRIQLLEDLCAHDTNRRREVLLQLAGGEAEAEAVCANVLTALPPQFNPGRLMSAGSYGRVYAGTYGDQPAALKLLLLDEETAHAILNEVRLCLKLSHRNLVQLLDCAVVATNKHAGAGHLAPASSPSSALTGHHQILPLFGSSPATPSGSCTYSYLPVMSGQGPLSSSLSPVFGHHGSCSNPLADTAAASRDAGSTSLPDLPHTDSRAFAGLGHVCFEVWIAMELCDGGTLAEQLQHGFHCYPGTELVDMEQLLQVGLDVARALAYMHRESVCHGDLKAENVLLKTFSPSSTADAQQCCPSCGNRSCCQEDCSLLMFLCSSPSGSYGGSTAHCCRSISSDSCWSCYPGGYLEGGSSSPDTCSSASSNASGLHAERRSRSTFKGHLLSGLCCMGSPLSCATADDVWDEDDHGQASAGCLLCGGAMHAGGLSPVANMQQQAPGYEQPADAAAGLEGVRTSPLVPLQHDQDSGSFAVSAAAAAGGHTGGSCGAPPPLHRTPFHTFMEGVPPPIVEGQEQQLLASPGEQHGSTIPEEAPEAEEIVAPLSLYTQRQRRRSRCLPPGVVLPAALAAAAAAAAGNGDCHLLSPASSGAGSSSSSGSDDDAGAAHSKKLPPQLPRQGSLEHEHPSASGAGPAPADPASMLPASAAVGPGSSKERLQDLPASRFGWLDPAVAASLPPLGVPACHDVYAHSMMLPPVPRRPRRHSYCYGTAASYGASVLSFNRTGLGGVTRITPAGSISATQAATAIAAAADAVRHDSSRAAAVRKARRMSWDDHMLRQHHSLASGGLSGLLGAALPSFGRASVDPASSQLPVSFLQQQPPSAAAAGSGGRTRRHSWAGYLQRDAALAASVEAGWGVAGGAAQFSAQPLPIKGTPGTDVAPGYGAAVPAAAAGSSSMVGPPAAGSSRSGRMRRHSWAGHGLEPGGGKLPGFSALSSCCAAGHDAKEQLPGDAAGHASLQCSPQRHLLSLPPLAGWCGDSSWRTLDDTDHGADSCRQALLNGVPSSSMCVGPNSPGCLLLFGSDEEAAAQVGCFGKCASSCASSSAASSAAGGGTHRRRRRYSWCCGAGSEAELWAVLNREDSNPQLGLLSSGDPLSVPLLPEQPQQVRRQRRDRRCSWDDFRYRRGLSNNWGRKASSLDAQISTPNSWRSQRLDGMSSPAVGELARSHSDAALRQQAAAAGLYSAAAATGEASAPLVSSGSGGLLPQLRQGAGSKGGVTPHQRRSSSLMQLASLSPSCEGSPAAAGLAGDVSARPATSSVATLPAPAPNNSGGSRLHAQGDQSALAPQLRLALPLPRAGSRTLHYFLEQVASGVAGTAAAAADPRPAPQQQQACMSLLQCSSSASSEAYGLADTTGQSSTRQVTVQDLLSSNDRDLPVRTPPQQEEEAEAALAGRAGATVLPAIHRAVKSEELPPAPFTGSFSLQLPADHAAGLHPAAGDSAAAGSSGRQPGGKGRRWSTGVAAQQLLLRKQLLDKLGSDVGVTDRLTAELDTAAASTAAGPQAAAAGGWGVAATVAAEASQPNIVPAPAEPGPARSCQQQGPALVSGPNALAAIDVLGMPRQPTVVLSQRRMSYDTATGAYQLVAQLDAQQLQSLALDSGHPSGELHWLPPLPPQQQQQRNAMQQLVPEVRPLGTLDLNAGVGPAAVTQVRMQDIQMPEPAHHTPTSSLDQQGPSDEDLLHDQQMQQQCQAQMQRLVEALAKKGYGGLMDHEPGSSSSWAAQQGSAAAIPAQPQAPRATLQQQQQVASDVAQLPRVRFCAKVCDFGFSKCLRAGQSHCSTASAGTITHQAPEVLRHGHLSPAADIYAFGIIMWELLTRDRPFKGLLEGDLVVGVCDRGLRPAFPAGCPASYVALAQQCWSDDPAKRPTAAQLVKRLHELLYEERRARLRASMTGRRPNEVCRPRRHSMPVQGDIRHRRRSRRMSVFLLPFRQPPAVPEESPLESQIDDTWPCTASGHHTGTAAWSGGHARRSAEHKLQQQPSMLSGVHRAASIGMSSSQVAVSGPVNSSSSNVVVSTGGLLAGSSAPGRLRAGSAAAAAGAVSGHASAPHIATAAAAAAPEGDGTEWFESF